MTYEELVLKVRDVYEYADAREVYEHVAVQVNVTGEAAGAFYIEIANRQVCVEPYDYHDRDALVTADTSAILSVLDGSLDYKTAISSGVFHMDGNPDKIALFNKVKLSKRKKHK